MADARDLGSLTHLSAEAIGEPGRRRFRLRAMNGAGDAAAVWLEKEQLTSLGEALESVLKDEDYRYQGIPLDDAEPEAVFPLSPDIDFRGAQMSMGLDRDARRVVLTAADTPEGSDDAASVSMRIDYRRAYELRRQIVDVVSAGRKPCPLCTAPMDPAGHVCVRSNGHQPH
jgi:uncharacterized repeat protein (TIGR03847 family)